MPDLQLGTINININSTLSLPTPAATVSDFSGASVTDEFR